MMSNHVILCGLGRVGRRVLDFLQEAGVPVVVIDSKVEPADAANVRTLRGDFRKRELLEDAGLATARGIFLLTSDDLVNLSALMTVLNARPGLRTIVRMFNPEMVSRLGGESKNVFALSTSALTAPMFALLAHAGGALASFDLTNDRPMLVAEWTVPEGDPLVGQRIEAVSGATRAAVVAHRQTFFADVDASATVHAGDRLTIAGSADVIRRLTGSSDAEFDSRTSWVSSSRRFVRMASRLFAEIDLPVKICTFVLIAVIAISVLIFRFGMRNDTTVDAFYRTISLMATGADMKGQDAEPGSWQKAFISMLRIFGAAVTAAFTAILTNYLVRAQFGGALEVRKIPERGHVIIAGLGNVGYRVLQELVRLGDQVVVIERNRVNTFIATARRAGAAVILGDALVAEALDQAHAGTARAIVVATENELTNLEIALLVRELHPTRRLLVRLIDPQFAGLLRSAANIHLALSIPELAAPAFLAAFLGDRIRTVMLAQGQILAIVDVLVRADDVLAQRPADEWATRYRLLPLAITSAGGVIDRDIGSRPLEVGEVLTAIVTFRDVHGLFQRGL